MSDKAAGGIKAGSIDVSLPVELRTAATSVETTGKVYTDVTGSYWRQGGTRTAITMATLGTVNAAHSDGGFVEVDATNMPGIYRFDVPDAAFATGADWVVVTVKVTSSFVQSFMFALETSGAAEVAAAVVVVDDFLDTEIAAIKTKTDYLPSATAGAPNGLLIAGTNSSTTFSSITVTNNISVGTTVTFTGAFTASNGSNNVNLGTGAITAGVIAADAIGVSEFAVATIDAIVDAVWNEATSGHVAAGSTGKALTDASAAGNPWSALTSANTDAGSFGLALGTTIQTTLTTIDDFVDAEVLAIKAKTDLIPAAPAAVGDIPTALQNADAMLNRDMSAVSDTNARSPLNALRFLRNKWSISGTTLTVTEEDDTTAAWTSTVTTNASADPVTGNDPA